MQQATTIEEIRAQEQIRHAEYEANTVADLVDGQPVTIAQLREAFELVEDPTNWKLPLAGYVHHSRVGLLLAAIRFFHGRAGYVGGIRPIDGWVLVGSDGYACD